LEAAGSTPVRIDITAIRHASNRRVIETFAFRGRGFDARGAGKAYLERYFLQLIDNFPRIATL
jgi:hypothetical protein